MLLAFALVAQISITQQGLVPPTGITNAEDSNGAALAQWMYFLSTSDLGAGAHSMLQITMGKDQTAFPNANGLFIDTNGNYTIASHLNLGAAANNSIGNAIGVHGPDQWGIAFDIDDTNNTSTAIRIAQGGTNGSATQDLIDIRAEENLIDSAYGGSFTGKFTNFKVRGVSKFSVAYTGAVASASSILSSSATAGVGYTTGAGGTVTQDTNKSTTVTLNTVSGRVTMHNANLAAGAAVTFIVLNSTVAGVDVPVVCHSFGGTAGAYDMFVSAVADGAFAVTVRNITGGDLAEAAVVQFAVIKGAAS